MPPNEVNANNEGLVRARLYPSKPSIKKLRWRYKVGDSVRIASARHTPFAKGYTAKWTRELFKIDARVPTVPVTYTLRDLMNEPIKGKFYEPGPKFTEIVLRFILRHVVRSS